LHWLLAGGVEFFESAWTDYSFSPSLEEAGSLGVRVLPPPPEVAAFRFMEVTGKRNRVMLSLFKRL